MENRRVAIKVDNYTKPSFITTWSYYLCFYCFILSINFQYFKIIDSTYHRYFKLVFIIIKWIAIVNKINNSSRKTRNFTWALDRDTSRSHQVSTQAISAWSNKSPSFRCALPYAVQTGVRGGRPLYGPTSQLQILVLLLSHRLPRKYHGKILHFKTTGTLFDLLCTSLSI